MVFPFLFFAYTVLEGAAGFIFHRDPVSAPVVAAGTHSGFWGDV